MYAASIPFPESTISIFPRPRRGPGGGLFVWVRLPEGIDHARLLDRAVKEAGVAFVPGATFFHDGRGRNTMRLSYSLAGEIEIGEGIARLARLI